MLGLGYQGSRNSLSPMLGVNGQPVNVATPTIEGPDH